MGRRSVRWRVRSGRSDQADLNSDRAIDTGVLIGLYAIGFFVELVTLVRGGRAVRSDEAYETDKR